MNELFLKIINMSISASWLVLAVLLLRFVLKKAPKWVNVLLWGIVAVRLAFPFSIESALSLIPSAETIPPNIGMNTTPTINSGINAINNAVNPIISQSNTPMAGASVNPLQITIGIFEYIWIFGMIALALYTAISYWRLHRKVDTAVRYKDNIFQSENVKSPFVLGIIKPRIYLPFNMNGQDLEHVVAHEQAHIHRKDHWWKPFGFLLLTIHWFNPLVWLAYVLLCRDIELACDERVIKELGNEQRADYTQALVACSVNRRMIAACPLAFGEVGVKDRVKSVMNYKKPAFWGVVLAVIVCVFVAVCFLTNPVTKNNGTDGTVTEWFDYLETPDEMVWDGRLEINLPEFPGVTFRWYPEKMEAVTEEGIVPLFHGMPIWNTYFCDLTGDRIPDLCSTYTFGSGIIDSRIIIYDYANGASYELSDRGYFDFTLRFNEADGYLYVDKTKYNTDELVETGRLVFKNNSIQIEGFSNEAHQVFRAEILEIHDGHYLVKPVEGSWELNSADRIVVPISNAHPSPEPEIGNVIEIEYSGEILESYPAQIADVYGIKLIREAETWDLIPMVMVNGTLYLDTGHESTIEARCGVMDGEITSQVDGSKQPTVDDQSNFGTGYGYQYGATEGTIELFMNGKWWIFATEEARQAILFPSTENEPSKFYLTIGSEGVKSIKLSMPNSSGGFENADGSLLKKGERIWLENLDGYTDLRGLTITALGENGEIIWTASIPDEEENKGFTHLVNDDWEITNIE
ncbi:MULTISPECIES: M56 family metallopeptidase [Clostridia]|uniref:M56 family metallopeptidase n=1 Tax=Clostridia TaxID=186801 RepID=UPI00325BFFE2